MVGHPNGQPNLCLIGRALQKVGCLPDRNTPNIQFYYPIDIRPVDNSIDYSHDIKFKPGPRLPPPQPDEPKPHMTPHVGIHQHKPPRTPKSPKKTPVAQTVPLSTIQLPVNTFPACTPVTTCVTMNVDLPLVRPTAQINHTPYLNPLSSTPHTPRQNAVPDSILQDLGNIPPNQYIWNTPHGVLTYTPAPSSHHPLPNLLTDLTPYSLRDGNPGGGSDGIVGLGLIPGSVSSGSSDSSSDSPSDLPQNSPSGSSSDCSDSHHQSGIALNPFLASNCPPSGGTSIEWNVSEHPDMAWHEFDNAGFLAGAGMPATDPPINTLRIKICFIDQPGVRWNWEPIVVNKPGPIQITDVLHAIYSYFQLQLTHSEFDIIRSHGRRNEKAVVKSWRGRIASHSGTEAQSQAFHGGLRRVDCLGSSKIFAGLWVDGSRLKLGLRV